MERKSTIENANANIRKLYKPNKKLWLIALKQLSGEKQWDETF